MEYRDVCRDTDDIVKDEAARRLRLRIILLENENDELHEQLAVGDERIDVAEQEIEELYEKLRLAQDDLSQKEAEMRSQAREVGNLKVWSDSI
jgi:chromosome segregation ATPase